MGFTSGRRYANAKGRRGITDQGAAAQRPPTTPITITTTVPGDTTTVTFDQPIMLSGVPQWKNNAGSLPLTAVLTGPAILTLTYPIPDVTTSIIVIFETPEVRNNSGGYVISGTFS